MRRHRGLQRERPPRPGPTHLRRPSACALSPVEIKRFSNDCLQAQLQANCRQRDVYIVQPLVPPTQEHLMELLLMIDAARGASAAQITAVIPHYAYARSDKKDASRISLGGRLVADMLVTAGVDRVLTMTLHAPQVHGFFSVPVDHLTAHRRARRPLPRDRTSTNSVVVSPDLGNAKTATQFARLLGLPVAAGRKQRLADDRVVIDSIVGDVAGKRAIVLDDEIATGGSIVELLDRLADLGCTAGRRRLHPRPVRRQGGRAAARAPDDRRGRHHRHRPRAGSTGPSCRSARSPQLFAEAITADPRRRVGEQPVRRRRPHPCAAPGHRCSTRSMSEVSASRELAAVRVARPARRPGLRPALRHRRPGQPRRGSHPRGVLGVAWPFVVALLVGWAVRTARAGWPVRMPGSTTVWLVTVVLGLVLRVATGGGFAWSFGVVTLLALGLFLVGWRCAVEVFRFVAGTGRWADMAASRRWRAAEGGRRVLDPPAFEFGKPYLIRSCACLLPTSPSGPADRPFVEDLAEPRGRDRDRGRRRR